MTTDFDLEVDLASEGTPRKRALFGRGCGGGESPINNLAEAQGGYSADYDVPGWPHSSGVEFTNKVACLQREVKDLRTESMFNHTGGDAILASALAPDRFYVD